MLASWCGERLAGWIEGTLEEKLGLKLNRDKTRVVPVRAEGRSLDFLGFTFRFDRDRLGRAHRYLNVTPSRKTVLREYAVLREMTGPRVCFVPVPELIQQVNRHLRGWAQYFRYGYPRQAFRQINGYVLCRLVAHLGRRSQRRFRWAKEETRYHYLQRLGLIYL